MPMEFLTTAADTLYNDAFLVASGPDHVKLDVSAMTAAEVDANGYLKPNVPLKQDGTLASGAAGETIHGFTREAIKLPGRTNNAGLGADVTDPLVAVMTFAQLNRDIAEGNLGRAFTPNELAAMKLAARFPISTT